jgi:putative transcriptional regulator
MAFTKIEINRDSLTIMGVPFPDRHSLERAANAIGSNMYEGFEPTPSLIELYRDFVAGKVQPSALPALIKERL